MIKEPTKQVYQEFMEDTKEAVERLIVTVDSLLHLAGNTGQQKTEEILLYDLLVQVADDLKKKARERQVSITVSGENLSVNGNTILLYRIFYNLMDNAVKYNRQYGSVKAEAFMTGKGPAVRISDTGIGMEQETVRHIFEPFYRGDHSRSQEIPGSGLGMSIVHFLMKQQGGSLEIESRPGEGSAFVFYF